MAEATTLGPYDKVIALSQGMLNEGLKKMFSIYPTLRRFVYIDAAFVTLKMDLLAPQILIQSNSQTFFQLRIEYGTIESPLLPSLVNVEGWEISHPFDASILLDYCEEEEKLGKRTVKGDFGLERLFAILSSTANNGLVIDPILSKCPKKQVSGNAEMDWKMWSSLPETQAFSRTISDIIFAEWPKHLQKRNYSCLGLKFELPAIECDPKPESRKLFAYHNSLGAKVSDDESESAYNSILVTQLPVGAAEDGFSDAVFSTNILNEIVSNADPTITHGFWSICHQRIFEDTLLPHLATLVEASQIIPLQPVWEDDAFEPEFSLLRDFTAAPLTKSPGAACNFERVKSPAGAVCYRWHKKTTHFVMTTKDAAGRQGDANVYTSSSSMTCTVTWARAKNTIEIDFISDYPVESKWSGTKQGLHKYTSCISWKFTLVLGYIEGKCLNLKMSERPRKDDRENHLALKIEDQVSDGHVAFFETQHTLALEDFVGDTFIPSVYAAIEQVKPFFDEWSFELPETRWFDFSHVSFNSAGDVIASVQYKTPCWQNVVTKAPPLHMPVRVKTPPPPPPEDKITTKLTWTYETKFQSAADGRRLRLVITGKNSTAQTLSFAYVEVIFSSGRKGEQNLFSASKFPFAKNTVELLCPRTASLEIGALAAKETFKATVNGFRLQAGEEMSLAIDGSTLAKPGAYSLAVMEAWKDAQSGEYGKMGDRKLDVVVVE